MLLLSYGIGLDGNIYTSLASNPYVSYGLFVYWITKYYELLDTVFMLLRHKIRQMSFLHVFHHASMALLSDYSYNYAPYITIAFGLCMNSFVHVVMYGYYALTALSTQTLYTTNLMDMCMLNEQIIFHTIIIYYY